MGFEDLELPGLVLAGDVKYKSADEEEKQLANILNDIADIKEISAVKMGTLTTGTDFSLEQVAKGIRVAGKKVIYDMQKMGQDIPAITGKQAGMFGSVADAVIVYPKSAEHWRAAYNAVTEKGSKLITVLYMTDGYDDFSKKMELATSIIMDIRKNGGELWGVVLPANNLEIVTPFINTFKTYDIKPIVFGPGIKTQGGKAYEAVRAGIDVPIVGGAIYDAKDPASSTKELVEDMVRGYKERKTEVKGD